MDALSFDGPFTPCTSDTCSSCNDSDAGSACSTDPVLEVKGYRVSDFPREVPLGPATVRIQAKRADRVVPTLDAVYGFTALPGGTATITPTELLTATDTPTPSPTSATAIPTGTAGATITPTQTPTATPSIVTINVGSVSGAAGTTQTVDITLSTAAMAVQATRNIIAVEPTTNGVQLATRDHGGLVPDCFAGDVGAAFAFFPVGCTPGPGVDCGVRAVTLGNPSPIPNDAVLYRCRFTIAAGIAPGTVVGLNCPAPPAPAPEYSDPMGEVRPAACRNGTLTVQ
jgi:hypothetical protein